MPRSPFKPLIRPLSGSAAASRPTFKLFSGSALEGVDNLDPSLTINSQTVTPSFRYKGGDATGTTWDEWDSGEQLTLQVGTAPTLNEGSPLLGSNDDSVLFNGGGYYQTAGSSNGQIATGDFVLEAIVKAETSALLTFMGTRSTATGWMMSQNTDKFSLILNDGGGNTTVNSGVVAADGSWYHVMIFADRSGSAQVYVNGAVSDGAVDISSQQDSLNVANKFNVGARGGGGLPSLNNVAYISMWEQSAWLDTHLQTAVAKERFQKLTGIYPTSAEGTATPTVDTRATTAHLDKIESGGERKIYNVGAGWLRCVSRNDSASTNIKGYLAEAGAENLILQSEDLGTTWTKLDAGDTVGGSLVAPNGSTSTTAGVIGDATDGVHGLVQSPTITAVSWTFSAFAKKGDQDWAILWNNTIVQCRAYFNLSTGVIGTVAANATAYMEDWGNGWYRCAITFTGTAAAHQLRVQAAEADNDTDFIGDGATVNTHFWGAQAEIGVYPTSYVPTTTVAVTRNADELRYKGDDGNLGGVGSDLQGSAAFSSLLENYNTTLVHTAFQLSDGGATADRILGRVNTTDQIQYVSAATGGNAGDVSGTTDVVDGVIHTVGITWKTDEATVFVDNVLEATDSLVDIPNDLDRIDVGRRGAVDHFNGVISDLKLYKKVNKRS